MKQPLVKFICLNIIIAKLFNFLKLAEITMIWQSYCNKDLPGLDRWAPRFTCWLLTTHTQKLSLPPYL